MENFNVNLAQGMSIQSTLLMDIYAWQQIIIRQLAKEKSEKTGESEDEILKEFLEKQILYREAIFKAVFIEKGPDFGDSLQED